MCQYTLAILVQKKVRTVLLKYVLERQRKVVRRRHTYIAVNSMICEQRCRLLVWMIFHEIVDMGAKNDDRCHVVLAGLLELRERIGKSICDSN